MTFLNMNNGRGHQHLPLEILLRFILGVLFVCSEYATPFHRKIQLEEIWLYRYPRTESYMPTPILWPFICIVPFFIIFITNLVNKNKVDGLQAFLAISLAFGINGVVTNIIKLVVGRPRPDFFYRCFPDGKGDLEFPCTGKKEIVIEGLKSFPSGHASFAFASMMFCTLYLCGKLQTFNPRGRGKSWRLLLSFLPLMAALIISVSRTCDYHHHWQDVTVGSLLGAFIAYLCYFQYYPSLNHLSCTLPNCMVPTASQQLPLHNNELKKSESMESISVKWI